MTASTLESINKGLRDPHLEFVKTEEASRNIQTSNSGSRCWPKILNNKTNKSHQILELIFREWYTAPIPNNNNNNTNIYIKDTMIYLSLLVCNQKSANVLNFQKVLCDHSALSLSLRAVVQTQHA